MVRYIIQVTNGETGGQSYTGASNVLNETLGKLHEIVEDVETNAPSHYSCTLEILQYEGNVLNNTEVLAKFENVRNDVNAVKV